MQTLEQLTKIKPYEILSESDSYITIKLWNCRKAQRYFKQCFNRDILSSAAEHLSQAIENAKQLLQRVQSLEIGQTLVYITGYNCTLHQFVRVEKKTAKTVFLREFSYQGMSCIAKPENLTDKIIRVPFHKMGRFNDYHPNRIYENNED